ncbi:MAG TPA: hypothetical protein VL326_24015 [Kofleriaceae bacterium]|jgi:hypothetical protein|nr:hypothetical protein [Kofleriaceae bacterium]
MGRGVSICIFAALGACGSPSNSGDDTTPSGDANGSGSDGAVQRGPLRQQQYQLAMDLRGSPDFMIGIGNDNQGPYTNNVPIDLHYAYLNGYGDGTGWPTWNTNGDYPYFFEMNATAHQVTAMFTYYQLALELENNNDAALNDTTRMHQYLSDWRLLFQKIAANDMPVAVNIEPDFFGYLMTHNGSGIPAKVHHSDVPECAALPETAAGLMQCVIKLGRTIAPKARLGFHASMWGHWYDVLDANSDIEGSANAVGDFLMSISSDTDFVSVETLDRDAGFWETSGGGSTCSTTNGSRGAVYWDETNTSLPNFSQHLRWVKALTARMNRPALEWQTPLGLPSTTCGGTTGHWRDNRVHYFFGHIPDLIDAGIAGITFGTGAGGQTNLGTDSGQFKTAAMAYKAAPVAL